VRAASARFREKQRENQQDRLEEIMTLVRRFLNDESGATAIEYGLIAGLVAVAIIAALTALGSSLNNLFSDISDTVNASAS
jgi:pilus assembly protein Flp/PilA